MKTVPRWGIAGIIVLLAGALAFGAIACDDDNKDDEPTPTTMATEPEASAAIPEVSIDASGDGGDYAFDAPDSIEGGVTTVAFTNSAQIEDHQAQLVKLEEGTTYDDFVAQLPEIETEADVPGTLAGGPGAGPGLSNENVLDLEPGEYALLCVIPNEEGVPHAALGMIQPLEVTEPMGEDLTLPIPDATVAMTEFAFEGPETLPAGEITIDALNDGGQPHEMVVVQLAEGLTVDGLLALFAGEAPEGTPTFDGPPFVFYGQAAGVSPGRSALVNVNLEPGAYTLLCFFTDPDTGAPHAALGMSAELTIE